jgi:hypothetical protein
MSPASSLQPASMMIQKSAKSSTGIYPFIFLLLRCSSAGWGTTKNRVCYALSRIASETYERSYPCVAFDTEL